MIVVVGATGNTGSFLVNTLAKQGRKVRAVVRNLPLARERFGDHAELVVADLTQPETLSRALEGAKKLYVAVGGATGTPALVEVESRFIDRAKAAGVEHYVKVSGIDSRPNGDAKIQKMHGEIEEHLYRSGLNWTVLRPTFFMQNFLALAGAIQQGSLPMPTGAARASLIDARDISECAAAVLTGEGHDRQVYTLTGGELLSHADVAEQMSRVLEKKISFVDLPGAAFQQAIAGAGAPIWFAELLTDVYVNVFAAKKVERVSPHVEQLLKKKPRTLAGFLREHRAYLS
jgi:uncharacterized protein YbjT (DUF2867 family)